MKAARSGIEEWPRDANALLPDQARQTVGTRIESKTILRGCVGGESTEHLGAVNAHTGGLRVERVGGIESDGEVGAHGVLEAIEAVFLELAIQGGATDAEELGGHDAIALGVFESAEDRLTFKLGEGNDGRMIEGRRAAR